MDKNIKRRSFLTTAGVVGAGSLGGCLGSIPGLGGNDGGGSSGAQQWPMPRGNAGNTGFSRSGGPGTGADTSYTATFRDGNRRSGWKIPRIGDDGIYALGSGGKVFPDQPFRDRLYVYRLSKTDGTETWRRILLERQEEGPGPSTATTAVGGPVLSSDAVFVMWADHERIFHVAALSREDGSTKWSKTLDKGATSTGSPVVHDGTLYCFDGRDALVALSTEDGSQQWHSKQILLDPLIPSVGDRAVALYVGLDVGKNGLILLDPEDGTERWTGPTYSGDPNAPQSPIPTVAGDSVYLSEYGSEAYSDPDADPPPRKIHALSVQDGSERWTHTYDTDAIRGAISAGGANVVTVSDDHVYYGLAFPTAREILGRNASQENLETVREDIYEGPNLVALNRSDGSVDWRTQLGTQARVFRPVVAGPDHLYAEYWPPDPSEGHLIYVVDRGDGEVVGQIDPADAHFGFSVADGRLYVHGGSEIRAWE